jgi:hypothetical protein
MKALSSTFLLTLALVSASASGADNSRVGIGLAFGELIAKSVPGPDGKPTHASLIETLSKVARVANEDMPMNIDSVTRIENISASPVKPTLTYNYTLAASLEEINSARFLQRKRPELVKFVCTHPGMRTLVQYGVTVEYAYRTRDGVFAGKIEVPPGDCK